MKNAKIEPSDESRELEGLFIVLIVVIYAIGFLIQSYSNALTLWS